MTAPQVVHPAVLILVWICLTVSVQSMHTPALLLTGCLVAVAALKFASTRFRILLRRTRWIMISLLLIYGYATPGTAVWGAGGVFSPTDEGVLDGFLQLCRLVSALAGLSLVLGMLTQQQLIGGLYVLAYPLRYLGLSRERLAVRLALTLHYAESAMVETAGDWRGSMERMLERPAMPLPCEIELPVFPITLRDGLLLAAGATVLAVVWL